MPQGSFCEDWGTVYASHIYPCQVMYTHIVLKYIEDESYNDVINVISV